jgi:hypothetical protein
MVQAADLGNRQDPARLRELDGSDIRRILVEREMSASSVIVRDVRGQSASQMPLAENDDMVQTLAPNRTDQALGERILPRASGSREDLVDPHALHALTEGVPVDRVAIAEEISGGGVVGEAVHDLLGGPGSGGMVGDVEVQNPASMMSEDDQDEEHPQLSGGNGEEVDRRDPGRDS